MRPKTRLEGDEQGSCILKEWEEQFVTTVKVFVSDTYPSGGKCLGKMCSLKICSVFSFIIRSCLIKALRWSLI